MPKSKANPCYWLSRLSTSLYQFQTTPSKDTKSDLLFELLQFQKQAEAGLAIPKTIPEAIRHSRTLSDWHRRQLDEAMAMFKINPSDDRMRVMKEQMDGYLDAVAMGRVKP